MGKSLPQLGMNGSRKRAANGVNPAPTREILDWHKDCNNRLDAVMAAV